MDERQRLEPLLRPGENLHWTGRPDPRVQFSTADVFLIPFSLLWGGFAIFWEYQVITGGEPLIFALFGVPFVLMGIYTIVGRFLQKRWNKRRTVYGLTDRRAIVSSSNRSFKDAPVQGTSINTNLSRNNGHATVIFGGTRYTIYQNTGMNFLSLHDQGVGFFDVPNPNELIRALDTVR